MTAVTAVPDARKGERLIMVTDKHGATRADFIAYARCKHASELMFPAEIIVLDKLPMLGSGKVDQSRGGEIRPRAGGGQGRGGGVAASAALPGAARLGKALTAGRSSIPGSMRALSLSHGNVMN